MLLFCILSTYKDALDYPTDASLTNHPADEAFLINSLSLYAGLLDIFCLLGLGGNLFLGTLSV